MPSVWAELTFFATILGLALSMSLIQVLEEFPCGGWASDGFSWHFGAHFNQTLAFRSPLIATKKLVFLEMEGRFFGVGFSFSFSVRELARAVIFLQKSSKKVHGAWRTVKNKF